MFKIILVILSWMVGFIVIQAQGTRIDFNTIPKNGTILIYAHLDDDAIWMLPFWKITEKFIGGNEPRTARYETIIKEQQVYLNNNGYNINYEQNWDTPWGRITDNEYVRYYGENSPDYQYLALDHLIAYWDNNDYQLVRREINRIKAKIEQYIASPSTLRIITHDNWGEYGHQHHKAQNIAVRELAVKYRKDVWMLGCNVIAGNFFDVDVPNGITYTLGSFNDPSLYNAIRTIYRNNGRWTYVYDQVPSGEHKFIKIVEGGTDKSNILTGESVTTSGPSQLEAGSYIFDGNDDYLTLGGSNNSTFTIAVRIRPGQIRGMDISAMSEYPLSSKNDRNLYLNNDGRISARINDGTSRIITSSTIISAGTWTNIAISGNGSNLKLYINGILDGTIPTGTAITNYSTPELILGQATRTNSYFDGQINNVRIFDRVLSDYEIAQLSGRTFRVTSSAGTGGTITPSGSLAVNPGLDITFNIRANSGYRIADVRVDNISVGTVSSYEFTDVSNNHSISASFHRISCTIDSEAGKGGNIDPEGEISVNYGSNHSFSIEPEPGYQISDVRVDNISVGAVTEYTFYNITTSHTISALFTPIVFNIESMTGLGGSINPQGLISTMYGHDQGYSITPAKGYKIADVFVDSVSVGAVTDYAFRDVTSDHSISAEFTPVTFSLTSIYGIGGSISPAGIISILYGHDQDFSFTPAVGYQIADVYVDNVSVGAVTNYTFREVTSDHSVSVGFKPVTYTITGISGQGGSINPAGEVKVNHGNDQHIRIVADYGYKISNVIIDYHPVYLTSNEFNFNNVTQDHTIFVTFSKMPTYVLKSGSCINGTIYPQGDTIVFEGSDQSYSIIPAPGYRISNVFIDTAVINPVSEYAFNDISADHLISATFSSSVELNIYPNPFRQEFRIIISSPYNYNYEISILTLDNRIVYMNHEIPANTTITLAPEISPGFYILNIYHNGKRAAFARIVKN